ncbi:MAG: accessory gene regulator B family protein [Clostridia bacterium]|nr:accessory gene regulator B family protein [Clostridia bacterium]
MRKLSYYIAQKLIDAGGTKHSTAVVAYGIECTLSTLLILVLQIVAGLVIGKPMHILVFILSWLPIRMIVGGAHANTHFTCTLISVGLGVLSILFSESLIKTQLLLLIVLLLIGYCVLFFTAPVIHKNHPISQQRFDKTRTIARIYAAVECAAVITLMVLKSTIAMPALMGYLSTASLLLIGWFSKNTDKTCLLNTRKVRSTNQTTQDP